ncbi:hypothetical protein YN1HA_10170 [Sulfurisphaera ohwakuensis]
MTMGKLTYVVIIISVIVIVSLFWINFPSIFPPSIKEMRNTFSASVTTPKVNVNGINSTTFSLSFSIKVSIPDYSGRVFLASGVIPLGANPCSYLPQSFLPNITPPAIYSSFFAKTFWVMLLNSTIYTENKTFRVSLDAVSTPNNNWVFLSQGFNLNETPVVWIIVFENHHAYRIGVIEFERVGEGLLYIPKIERC